MPETEIVVPITSSAIQSAAGRIALGETGSTYAYKEHREHYLTLASHALHAAFPEGYNVLASRSELITRKRIYDAADAILTVSGHSPSRTPSFDPTAQLWAARWAIEAAMGCETETAMSEGVFCGIADTEPPSNEI